MATSIFQNQLAMILLLYCWRKPVRTRMPLRLLLRQFKPLSCIQVKSMAKLRAILLIALFSLSLLATSLHNHESPGDRHSCSFCLLVQDFSAVEIVTKPVLIIPQVNKAVITPISFKILHTSIKSTMHSRAPPVLSP